MALIQNVLFAIFLFSFVVFFSACSRDPTYNYATNVWAPVLKAGLLSTADCASIKGKKHGWKDKL